MSRQERFDSRSTDELLGLFARINAGDQTILMVTHSVKAASKPDAFCLSVTEKCSIRYTEVR